MMAAKRRCFKVVFFTYLKIKAQKVVLLPTFVIYLRSCSDEQRAKEAQDKKNQGKTNNQLNLSP
jgi:hypothetical protein